jgi:hypothetical protein
MTERAGKTLAGVARAAARTDAIIIDSGLGTGIEKFCMRRDLPLIGIAPENEVRYPRINSTFKKEIELTNGHTHFLLIGDNEDDARAQGRIPKRYFWGDEAHTKIEFAKRLSVGRQKKNGPPACKIVLVCIGDNALCHKEMEEAVANKIPMIIVEGSGFVDRVLKGKADPTVVKAAPGERKFLKSKEAADNAEAAAIGKILKHKFVKCTNDSEQLAQIIHLMLAVKIY